MFSNQNDPIFHVFRWPPKLCISQSARASEAPRLGILRSQYTQLLQLTCPQSQKYASSLNQTLSRKSVSSSILFLNHWHITKHFSMSAGVSLCLIWILYGHFFKILCSNAREKNKFWGTSLEGLFWIPSNRISHCIHIVRTSCSQLPARSGFSTFLLRLFTDPVA